ncbi:uncharacterized protein TNCV_2543681 [Trichonephila clavipes]|nr:uncharacterized protein TNCV_2543681 [Trichonephila clavipes]
MPAMHLAEHIGMAFTHWVVLPGKYTSDLLRPFRPGTLSRHDEIYTDGSMGVGDVSGSGILIKKRNGIKRNPDYCSGVRAELLAIEEALKFCFTESVNTDIWMLSDSRSSNQYLSKWWKHGDRTTTSIVQAAIKTWWLPDFFRNGYPGQTRYQFLLETGPLYISGKKETVLVLLCLGQAVGELKLPLLGFAGDILELNGIYEHDFAASKATDHDVVGDEIENNSANTQTLVVENQHINLPEEPEHMANADYDALKKRLLVFFFISNHCLKQHNGKEQKEEQETLRKQRREARETKKGVKKFKLSSCRPRSIKPKPKSPVASTSKDGVIKYPTCEEEYCDPPTGVDPVL